MDNVKGKRVVLVDDSIVRGTTSGRIVKLLRDAGAKEIHMRISSPPFLHPSAITERILTVRGNLISAEYTVDEIAERIGADSLGYLSVENLSEMIGNRSYCSVCFDGDYPTAIPSDTRKRSL